MKVCFNVFVCLAIMVSMSFARNIELTGRFVPPNGKTYLFGGQNNVDSDNFAKTIGRVPYGFMIYTSLAQLDGLNKSIDFGAGQTSGKYILQKYPSASLQIGLSLVGGLQDVIDGNLDKNIIKLADWIKKAKVPVFLRIGYEFDYPSNGYAPDLYVKAYKIIADKLDENGVDNAAYVWHSYASLNPKGIEAWYPGDEYVDWCAISYFANPQWIPMVNFAKKRNKPLMIAECSPVLGNDLKESGKMYWYKKLFRFIENYEVKALCYINAKWDEQSMFAGYNWGNCRLDSNEEIKNFWLEKISNDNYILN